MDIIKDINSNNYITISGKIYSECEFSHTVYGEGFYSFKLSVKRLSGNDDIIPITISERLFNKEDIIVGRNAKIEGQVRSYNDCSGERNRLVISVFAKEIYYDEGDNENHVEFNGFICRKPVYRKTPMGREISDILVAVNRTYNKSDYIPCIIWGRNARYTSNFEVSTKIKVMGRIQSRVYQKKTENGLEEKTAYEISISRIEKIEE